MFRMNETPLRRSYFIVEGVMSLSCVLVAVVLTGRRLLSRCFRVRSFRGSNMKLSDSMDQKLQRGISL